MSKKLRVFIWCAILSMGALVASEIAWSQYTNPEEVVVPPRKKRQIRHVGDVFRDCPNCPEMVVLPAGSFFMGGVKHGEMDTSPGWEERPVHQVTIGYYLAVGRYEVTFSQWNACVAEGGCDDHKPRDENWGKGNRPVINVNWNDAQNYLYWLSRKTGKSYLLLTEAEWEYAARAGTPTANHWGNDHPKSDVVCTYANIGRSNYSCGQNGKNATMPVGSFRPNPFGLYDMIGNVQEWTADCWNGNYDGAPADGRAWQNGDCTHRVTRGGSWNDYYTRHFRSASRQKSRHGWRKPYTGFRVARTMAVVPNPSLK